MKLTIKNLRVTVENKKILHGVSLVLAPGKVHAIMGPNGSGKSTLAYAVMAHPAYSVKGIIKLGENTLTKKTTEQRAKLGIFLGMQSPMTIPGVSVSNLLRTAYQQLHAVKKTLKSIQNPILSRRWSANGMSLGEFTQKLKSHAKALHIEESFLSRGVNEGFSGGEKKKLEMLQALMLEPKYVFLDEIDTGLDVDALKIVASAVSILQKQGAGIVLITHYQRILKYVKPDVVHILVNGVIVKSGNAQLAHDIEEKGYSSYAKRH